MPTALDNGHRSPRKLLRAVVARLLGRKPPKGPLGYVFSCASSARRSRSSCAVSRCSRTFRRARAARGRSPLFAQYDASFSNRAAMRSALAGIREEHRQKALRTFARLPASEQVRCGNGLGAGRNISQKHLFAERTRRRTCACSLPSFSRRWPGGQDGRQDRHRRRIRTRSRLSAGAARTPPPARPSAPRTPTPVPPRCGRA
jgi:hypothetical protein